MNSFILHFDPTLYEMPLPLYNVKRTEEWAITFSIIEENFQIISIWLNVYKDELKTTNKNKKQLYILQTC